ncbi:MAG: SPOR domain-containing protein [Caulobacteraceae bacterium]|nr:SPOR domain-containing protein [Caulobacteraceae bacterium]
MFSPARRIALALLLTFSTLVTTFTSVPAPAHAAIVDSPKYAAIVVDASTGEVLYARRADSPRYPASITKIMTLYLVFDALSTGKLKPDDRVVVSPRAAAQAPSKLGLAAGDSLTVDDAIRAVAVKSANDIAVALAEKVGGTEARFAAMMTLKAQELGMTNSRFVNANGLPDSRQLTSARDIAILSRAVMRDFPQYYPYFSQKYFTFRGQEMRNHNGLLLRMPGVDGLKTGFTNASGYNLAASGVRDGHRLITVVLGGPTIAARDTHVADLLNVGFDVMRRRDHGETITVAQSLFEPQIPSAPVAYAANTTTAPAPAAPARPRDYTADLNASGLRGAQPARGGMRPVENPPEESQPVVLASLAPVDPAQPSRPAATRVAPTPARAKPAPAKPKRDPNAVWVVQVGSFRARSDANSWVKEVKRRFAEHFAHARSDILNAGGRYRVRYVDMTQAAAKSACAALKKKKLDCLVFKGD